jgi:hypothetical protein
LPLSEWVAAQALHAPYWALITATALWFVFKHMLGHSRYHNRHHREFHTHYAFSLVWLDRWFSRAQAQKP